MAPTQFTRHFTIGAGCISCYFNFQCPTFFQHLTHATNVTFLPGTPASCLCNILTFDPAVNRETGASGRRYQDITLPVDGLNLVQLQRPREAGVCQTII